MFSPRLKESIADFESIYRTLSFVIPADLQAAMRELGAGYSKRKELLFFGNKNSSRSLLEWNQFIAGLGVYSEPAQGGPLFIAENCVGIQFGVRYESNAQVYMAFDPNSFDSFRLASSAGEFINIIMSDAELVTLCGTVYPLIDALGEVRPGYHYAPFVSPMFGGSMSPDNWSVAPVRAHLATCVAEFDAVAGLVGN